MSTIGHFINGTDFGNTASRLGDVFNPATGLLRAKVLLGGAHEVDAAVNAAHDAHHAWANTPAPQRARVLFRFKEIMERHVSELAEIITGEHGKTLSDATGEVTRAIEVIEFACGAPHLLKGEFSSNVGNQIDAFSLRQPLGVCVGITPFNFPVMVPLWMFGPALACGNAFILKPSEKTPSAALHLARFLKEAGLPDGVFNVVQGDREVVDRLTEDPRVAAISFVGSTAVAEHIYRSGTHAGKRVQALGGAKNHLVVMPDADMSQAVDAIIGAAFGSAGERCMAAAVAVAVGAAAQPLVESLIPRVAALRVGPGNDSDSEMGPLITKEHRDKVAKYIDVGLGEGADLLVDGRKLRLQGYEDGFFLGGSLFDRVEPEMQIYKEEIFGPVLCVVRAPTFDRAVQLVNDHPYGNGSAIFTRDGDVAREFYFHAKAGMIGVNVPIPVPMAFHSFGGWKRSLFGDHAIHGPEGIHFYTQLKTVTARWPTGIRKGADFDLPTMHRR